ncbi:hypothetical protein BDFB_004530 [Asbolus verrucosus]|uniref:Uncharacterized protein n=1 Tax=Asbolus verrucosus TaxID=1661398 RepID=A0A482VSV5_ASBVE|nr:hypothetical protein BDFB_004530 [Asbolus verrucosus]
MAPHCCKGCLRDIIAKMAEQSKKIPVEINGVAENGLPDSPCEFVVHYFVHIHSSFKSVHQTLKINQ